MSKNMKLGVTTVEMGRSFYEAKQGRRNGGLCIPRHSRCWDIRLGKKSKTPGALSIWGYGVSHPDLKESMDSEKPWRYKLRWLRRQNFGELKWESHTCHRAQLCSGLQTTYTNHSTEKMKRPSSVCKKLFAKVCRLSIRMFCKTWIEPHWKTNKQAYGEKKSNKSHGKNK